MAACTKPLPGWGGRLQRISQSVQTSVIFGAISTTRWHRNLIYIRQDGFEIINVETDAKLSETKANKDTKKSPSASNIFSSVISGEVPLGSYFIFASESLPEYISGLELVKIITKLPPIVAAEQIKNVLSKINNYVPFLGIIIKNTNEDPSKKIEEIPSSPKSAHNSISSL